MSSNGCESESINHSGEALNVQINNTSAVPAHDIQPAEDKKRFWTAQRIILSIFLFLVSGLAEIGGGWLVFQAIRSEKPVWWGVLGSLILIIYGFIPTFQPISNFGRVFAVYGG